MEEQPLSIKMVRVPITEPEQLERELNKLHDNFYSILEVKLVHINLVGYYDIFAHWTPPECDDPECEHCSSHEEHLPEDEDGPPLGFRGD